MITPNISPNVVDSYLSAGNTYPDLDADAAIKALSLAIQYKTTSYADISKMDDGQFKALHKHFEKAFPLVHQTMQKEVINHWSLIFYWPGTDPSLKPILFMAHLDTVPVMPGTEEDWCYPPYSGAVAEGFIWGRGSVDTKGMVVGELSAAEYLIAHGFKPKRGIYLAFGHDEETLGVDGTLSIAKHLEKKGVKLEYVLDEGGHFTKGDMYGAPNTTLACVAVFEKGYADISVIANDKGGHSSRPGKGTALGKVAKAIVAIEQNQFKPSLIGPVKEFFKDIAPYITKEPMKTYVKDIDSNPDELLDFLYEDRNLAPLVHTTTAATMINGSPAPNVLPQKVEAIFNFRTSPADSNADVVKHCTDAANDPTLEIKLLKGIEPSKISKTESFGMNLIKATNQKYYKGVVTVPFMVTGGTDCRYFEDICECCYRFRPYIDNMPLGDTAHATNERCIAHTYVHGIKYIIDLMKNSAL